MNHFQEDEAAWMRAFATAAVRNAVPLREIRVEFQPDEGACGQESSYSWDLMDDVSRDYKDAGIVVTYPKPMITKEDFLNCVHCRRHQSESETSSEQD